MNTKTGFIRRVYIISFVIITHNFILFSQINDIKVFLNKCPNNDPAINTILSDFEIRVNGVKVNSFPCTEPVSAMSAANYSNPLIYLQTLRVIYYMDRGMTGKHLPWTDKNLYDWMKDNVDGIDVRDGVSGGYCCEVLDGKMLFVTGVQDDYNREFDKGWRGISGNIDFFAHEIRHTNGTGYTHSSCCGLTYGCDNEYNESDLSPYGIQYWLNKSWLTGYINVGARTSGSQTEINDIISWHLGAMNSTFRTRFCNNAPAMVNLTDIPNPLGSISTFTEVAEIKKVNIYPNPISSGNDLRIVIPDASFCVVEIINTSGVVLKAIENNHEREINVPIDLKADIYIIKIQDCAGKNYYEKLIVK
jgi:hypothetical protein